MMPMRMLVGATQRKANMFLCPTENQAARGVRYDLTFFTRGDYSVLNEGQRGQCDAKEHGTYGMVSTTLSTPLNWQWEIPAGGNTYLHLTVL